MLQTSPLRIFAPRKRIFVIYSIRIPSVYVDQLIHMSKVADMTNPMIDLYTDATPQRPKDIHRTRRTRPAIQRS